MKSLGDVIWIIGMVLTIAFVFYPEIIGQNARKVYDAFYTPKATGETQ